MDFPQIVADDDGIYTVARGWWSGTKKADRIVVRVAGTEVTCGRDARPDVAIAFPGLETIGWCGMIDWSAVDGLPHGEGMVMIEVVAEGVSSERQSFQVPTKRLAERVARARSIRGQKRRWLAEALESPWAELARQPDDGRPVCCLSASQKLAFHVDDADSISAHRYDAVAEGIISDVAGRGGMVLDCGAGLRHDSHPHVVTAEIVPYPSTDVVCPNEVLPFRDGVFDAAFSLNVLEHVSNPLQSAAELMRVVKPGGRIYAVAPFLSPEHGYPHHFFNMTRHGMKRLFEGGGRVVDHWVSRAGHPIAALHWFLGSYAAGLPPQSREQFLNLRVKDVLAKVPEAWLDDTVCGDLAEEARWELACTSSMLVERI